MLYYTAMIISGELEFSISLACAIKQEQPEHISSKGLKLNDFSCWDPYLL